MPSENITKILIYVTIFTCLLFFYSLYSWGAARGSGNSTVYSIGPTNDQLYLVAAREEPGYMTGSTDSINQNFVIISSAIYDLESLAGNTNYVLIAVSPSLQSGSFYVSSGSIDGQSLLARTSGNVGISTSNPNARLVIGPGHFLINSSGFVSIATTSTTGLLTISTISPSIPIVHISTGSTRLFEITGTSVSVGASSMVVTSLVSCDSVDTDANGRLFCGSDAGSGGAVLAGGATSYIQNSSTLQSGSTFYASSGTVDGTFTAYGGINGAFEDSYIFSISTTSNPSDDTWTNLYSFPSVTFKGGRTAHGCVTFEGQQSVGQSVNRYRVLRDNSTEIFNEWTIDQQALEFTHTICFSTSTTPSGARIYQLQVNKDNDTLVHHSFMGFVFEH